MKNKSAIVQYLENEAARFRGLAKDIALDLLINPDVSDRAAKISLARDHIIRAETFKTAASIVAGHNC